MEPNAIQKLLKLLGVKAIVTQNDDDDTATVELQPSAPPQSASDPLIALNTALNGIGGVEGMVKLLTGVQATVEGLTNQFGGVEGISALTETVRNAQAMIATQQAKDDAEKAVVIASMVANVNCPFNEDELKGKPLAELVKLQGLMTPSMDYRALGGGAGNVSQNSAQPYRVPSVLLAPPVAAKQ